MATAIDSHTQVLDSDCALLAPPENEAFASGMAQLAGDPELRRRLGEKGKATARERYCLRVFVESIIDLYEWLEEELSSSR